MNLLAPDSLESATAATVTSKVIFGTPGVHKHHKLLTKITAAELTTKFLSPTMTGQRIQRLGQMTGHALHIFAFCQKSSTHTIRPKGWVSGLARISSAQPTMTTMTVTCGSQLCQNFGNRFAAIGVYVKGRHL